MSDSPTVGGIYPEWKRRACKWCANGYPMVVINRVPKDCHWSDQMANVETCTAPTEAERIAELEAALRPFADIKLLEYRNGGVWGDSTMLAMAMNPASTLTITVGDLHRAKKVLCEALKGGSE